MIKPVKMAFIAFSGSLRKNYRCSLYRFERTAKKLDVQEAWVYEAWVNRFFASMDSSTFCRLLLNGRLEKEKLEEWSKSTIHGHRLEAKIVDRKRGKVGTDQDVKNGNKGAGL